VRASQSRFPELLFWLSRRFTALFCLFLEDFNFQNYKNWGDDGNISLDGVKVRGKYARKNRPSVNPTTNGIHIPSMAAL
jgi:hypothetical protein